MKSFCAVLVIALVLIAAAQVKGGECIPGLHQPGGNKQCNINDDNCCAGFTCT